MFDARQRELLALSILATAVLFWSGWAPYDRPTWWLETAPVFIAAAILWHTRRSFPLTPLSYRLIFLHAAVLMVGGHYTYAKVPFGFLVQDWLGLSRNPYDRIGHFMQGLVPAILTREVLLRTSPLQPGKWLVFLVICVCTAISAWYEFLEWWTALALGVEAQYFLATQGDPWDTHWDMLTAVVGSIVALTFVGRLHGRQMLEMGFVAEPPA